MRKKRRPPFPFKAEQGLPRFPFAVRGFGWAVDPFYAPSALDAAWHVDTVQRKRIRKIEAENEELRYRIAGADGLLERQYRGQLESNERWLEDMDIWSDHIVMIGDGTGSLDAVDIPPGLVSDDRR